MIILYRYWSGIYHFFDSFGNSGKRSGIGMVLVFDCFDCLGASRGPVSRRRLEGDESRVVTTLLAGIGGDGGHEGRGKGRINAEKLLLKKVNKKRQDAQDATGRDARVPSGFGGSFWAGLPLP